ncbi:MAG: D-alanyl-D-alanine carboxypeptidase family protein [Candidatus Omnitrophota bacterium]
MNIIKSITSARSARKFLAIFLVGNLLLSGVEEAEAKKATSITARAGYAVDSSSKKVLFSRNPKMKFYPASTVKLLTALVVLDNMKLKSSVRVSRRATSVAPTKAGLTRGASYPVSDLLKVLLATSANDAGVALAEALSGSQERFALLMNKKARSLGCRNSNFTNPTGLPDKRQLTTAYDLYLITRAAFNDPFIASVMRQKNVTISGSDAKPITLRNHNKLLWRMPEPCVLGKTGYTRSAGHCYAGLAIYDDGRVIVVILKSRNPYSDIRNILCLKK